jgi:hypothetical protein
MSTGLIAWFVTVGSVFGLGLLLLAFKPRRMDTELVVVALLVFALLSLISLAVVAGGSESVTVTISEGALHK